MIVERPVTQTVKVELPFEPGYTLHEVAEIARMNHTYLYSRVGKDLHTYRGVDGTLRVSKESLADFLAKRKLRET
jgi:hypothetical protein